MKEVQYKKGDVIFREGELGKTFYQIINGKVGIYTSYEEDGEECLTTMGKDGYFGELAVIETYPRSATAVAMEDLELQELTASEMDEWFKEHPERIIEIMRNICARIRALTDDYADVKFVLDEMNKSENGKSEGLLSKIKKFTSQYKRWKGAADRASVECLKRPELGSHSAGFSETVEQYNKGTIIFKEGEIGVCMYDIHFGKVGIFLGYGTPGEKKLTELYANDFFGEMGMIENDTRSATAVVLEDNTIVESIYPEAMMELFEKNPQKVDMVMRHLAYRLRKLTDEYLTACKEVSERVRE